MWFGVIQIGLVMAFATLLTLDVLLPGGWFAGEQSIETSRSAAFTVLVLAQLFNAFNARAESISAFRGLFDNRWLWTSVGLGVVLQVAVVQWPLLNVAFDTVPLTLGQWALCLALGSTVLWFSELRKAWLRRSDAHDRAVCPDTSVAQK
jgi:magnesium-transporting ATPase (P-type)